MMDLEFLLEEDLLDEIELESSFVSKLMLPGKIRKYNKQQDVSINGMVDFIKHHGKNPGFNEVVKRSTDIEELTYLRVDTRTSIPTLKKLKNVSDYAMN